MVHTCTYIQGHTHNMKKISKTNKCEIEKMGRKRRKKKRREKRKKGRDTRQEGDNKIPAQKYNCFSKKRAQEMLQAKCPVSLPMSTNAC